MIKNNIKTIKKVLFSFCFVFLFFLNCESELSSSIDLLLSEDTIDENLSTGSVIGKLTIVKEKVEELSSEKNEENEEDKVDNYTLILGDNDFEIVGDKLKSTKVFDYETKKSYDISVKAIDSEGNEVSKNFIISINDVKEAAHPVFSYSFLSGKQTFYERNTGSIRGANNLRKSLYVLRAKVKNGEFIGNDEDDLKVNTHFTTVNVPAGLEIKAKVFKRLGEESYVVFYFTGNANKHSSADNVNNIKITLKSAILKGSPDLSDVISKSKEDISITYDFKYISYSAGFGDASLKDDGSPYFSVFKTTGKVSIASLMTTVIHEDTWVDGAFSLDTHYIITGTVPNGLLLSIVKTSSSSIFIGLSGTATSHQPSDSKTFTITFLDAALTSGDASSIVLGNSQDIEVIFE